MRNKLKNVGNEYEQDVTARWLALEFIRTEPLTAFAPDSKIWYLYRGDGDGFVWIMAGISPARDAMRTSL